MSNKKLGILFFITGLAVSVGLALSAAVVGSFYENKNQELYSKYLNKGWKYSVTRYFAYS